MAQKYIADNGGAERLLDEIAFARNFSTALKADPFQKIYGPWNDQNRRREVYRNVSEPAASEN
jgi:hypothetical protein